MRNAFVVLVSLCIGLASGFIVPSGVQELLDDNQAILAENNGKESEEAKGATLQEDRGFIVLPFRTHSEHKIDLETNKNRIKDIELYEQGTTKHSNVNERSFIYINQKFKTPVVNQLYSSHDLLRATHKPLLVNIDETNNNQYQGNYFSAYGLSKPKKEYFEANMERVETKKLYFPPAGHNQEMNRVLSKENKPDFSPKKIQNKVNDEKHEYVELLKPPLLRPDFTPDKNGNKMWILPDQSSLNYKPLDRNLHVPNMPVDPLQFSMTYYDNYGFPTPYGNQRSLPQFSNRLNELGKGTDSSVKKLINDSNNVDVNKLLDQYLKESLEDQVTNERIKGKNNNNCNYGNCVLKSTKQYLHSRIKGDVECKCGRRLNVLKQRESTGFEDKENNTDKDVRASSERNVVNIEPSSENSDYGEMLAEEMKLNKLIED